MSTYDDNKSLPLIDLALGQIQESEQGRFAPNTGSLGQPANGVVSGNAQSVLDDVFGRALQLTGAKDDGASRCITITTDPSDSRLNPSVRSPIE